MPYFVIPEDSHHKRWPTNHVTDGSQEIDEHSTQQKKQLQRRQAGVDLADPKDKKPSHKYKQAGVYRPASENWKKAVLEARV